MNRKNDPHQKRKRGAIFLLFFLYVLGICMFIGALFLQDFLPSLAINSPEDQLTTSESRITIAGLTKNYDRSFFKINGREQKIQQTSTADPDFRRYEFDYPLAKGRNTIDIEIRKWIFPRKRRLIVYRVELLVNIDNPENGEEDSRTLWNISGSVQHFSGNHIELRIDDDEPELISLQGDRFSSSRSFETGPHRILATARNKTNEKSDAVNIFVLPGEYILRVTSNPSGARVFIDCEDTGKYTPADFLIIAERDYMVSVARQSHRSAHKEEVRISKLESEKSVHFNLDTYGVPRSSPYVKIRSIDRSRYPEIMFVMDVRNPDNGEFLSKLKSDDFIVNLEKSESCYKDEIPVDVKEVGLSDTKIDLVFIMDTSGSMQDEMDLIKENIIRFANLLLAKKVDFRFALIAFDDFPPPPDNVFVKGFTSQLLSKDPREAERAARQFKTWIALLNAEGSIETSLEAIIRLKDLNFRPNALRYAILITDEPPSDPSLVYHPSNRDSEGNLNEDFKYPDNHSMYKNARRIIHQVRLEQFFFSAEQNAYRQLGQPLGYPFNRRVLMDELFTEITSKYIVKIRDPFGLHVFGNRDLTFTIKTHTSTSTLELEECYFIGY